MIGIWYFVIFTLIVLILFAFDKTRKILKSNLAELVYAISSYVFLLSDIKSNSDDYLIGTLTWKEFNIELIILGCLILFLGFILTYFKNIKYERFDSLELELKEAIVNINKIKEEFYHLCSDNIKDFFSDFFSTTGGNGRVSLYKHQESHFILLGRYSNNPIYNKKGLETYPDNEGFIALGWQQERFEIHTVPNWVGKSGTEYRNFMKENCSISDERLKKLTMKSRAFYIYRFNNHDASNPHGIIVFEKLDDSQIQTATIDTIFQTHGAQIISLLKSMKSLN